MTQLLGKLEKVDIRHIWEHEALSFTPWLAVPENLAQLGDALGIEFDEDDIGQEVGVGDFSADILTSDLSGRKVVIENQLERTDHDHLGKCITYAAGIGAEIIIWIARNVRDEHRQAVEYLNLNSSDKLNIFLVQLEAYKIGDSKPAPHFMVVESPNEWTKAVRDQNGNNVSEIKLKQQRFLKWCAIMNWRIPRKSRAGKNLSRSIGTLSDLVLPWRISMFLRIHRKHVFLSRPILMVAKIQN